MGTFIYLTKSNDVQDLDFVVHTKHNSQKEVTAWPKSYPRGEKLQKYPLPWWP